MPTRRVTADVMKAAGTGPAPIYLHDPEDSGKLGGTRAARSGGSNSQFSNSLRPKLRGATRLGFSRAQVRFSPPPIYGLPWCYARGPRYLHDSKGPNTRCCLWCGRISHLGISRTGDS